MFVSLFVFPPPSPTPPPPPPVCPLPTPSSRNHLRHFVGMNRRKKERTRAVQLRKFKVPPLFGTAGTEASAATGMHAARGGDGDRRLRTGYAPLCGFDGNGCFQWTGKCGLWDCVRCGGGVGGGGWWWWKAGRGGR